MPRKCPNCLADATRSWRVPYKPPLDNTRYIQTFYYCDACSDMLQLNLKTGRLMWLGGFVALALAIALPIVAHIKLGDTGVALIPAVPFVVVLTIWLARRRPKPKDAVTRGFAAYYAGQSALGLGKTSYFRALRPEWLDLLVELNPDAVDDAEYKKRVGREKPAKEKPF